MIVIGIASELRITEKENIIQASQSRKLAKTVQLLMKKLLPACTLVDF